MPPKHSRPWPRLLRAPTSLALCFALTSAPTLAGCKTAGTDGSTDRPGKDTRRASNGARLPKPLTLPADAPAYAYLRDPAAGLQRVQALSPEPLSLQVLVERVFDTRMPAPLAEKVAAAADTSRPWSGVELEDGESLAHVPISADAAAGLTTELSALPKAGEFGAVTLPAGSDGKTWLAWLREDAGAHWLTVGTSERAVVSGEALHDTYGRAGIVAGLDLSRLEIEGERPPVERIWALGEGDDLELKVRFVPDFDPLAELPITTGAMAELLADPKILLGASTRYRTYQKAVSNLISGIQDQIDGLPFLIKGFASDLAARFNAIARSWNGRFAVAFADGHVRLAYGADDAKKAGVAVLHFLRGAVDGISLARNFSSDVPDITLKKNAESAGDIAIHRLTLRKLKGTPPEMRPLLDDRRNLHIAMAFDASLGGGTIAVGPESVSGLKGWIESMKGKVATTAASPEAAARFSLSPAQLRKLAEGADKDLDITELWSWKAEGPPYQLEVRKVDERHWKARIQGPKAVKTASIAVPIKRSPQP